MRSSRQYDLANYPIIVKVNLWNIIMENLWNIIEYSAGMFLNITEDPFPNIFHGAGI